MGNITINLNKTVIADICSRYLTIFILGTIGI